jgi:RNA polymerase sigma-70 factor (ECF subfamily)
LKGFVYKRVRDKALAEDITHDVYLKAQSNIHQVEDSDRVLGWIYQIARNTITDHYRRKAKTIRPEEVEWDSATPNFNDCVSGVIGGLISSLPDKYRIPLEMAELGNISQLEVAGRLQLAYPTAKARVQRARQMLRKKIDEVLIVKTDGYGNVVLCQDRTGCC